MWCNGGMMNGMNGAWWIGGLLFWLLLLAAGIALVVWIVGRGRTGSGRSHPGSSNDRAISILRERFASGDIDETEYRDRLRQLTEPDS